MPSAASVAHMRSTENQDCSNLVTRRGSRPKVATNINNFATNNSTVKKHLQSINMPIHHQSSHSALGMTASQTHSSSNLTASKPALKTTIPRRPTQVTTMGSDLTRLKSDPRAQEAIIAKKIKSKLNVNSNNNLIGQNNGMNNQFTTNTTQQHQSITSGSFVANSRGNSNIGQGSSINGIVNTNQFVSQITRPLSTRNSTQKIMSFGVTSG